MNIKIIKEGVEEVPQVESVEEPSTTPVPTGDLLRDQVTQMFDLKDSEKSQYARKLDALIEYAKMKTDDHSAEGIKWALRSLGTKLGTPPLGEKLINYLHIYARLYMEGRRIDTQKEKFLKGERDD